MLEITIKDTERDTINTYEAKGIIFAACDDKDGTSLVAGELSLINAAAMLYVLQKQLKRKFLEEPDKNIDTFSTAFEMFSAYVNEEEIQWK